MERVKELIKSLNEFKDWELIGGPKTQGAGSLTEDFVSDCFKKTYGKDIVIYKMGSQQHPDFIIGPSSIKNSVDKLRKKLRRKKATLKVLNDWEVSEMNTNNIRLLRVEVKTGKTNYTLNDTFPNPFDHLDELYILFSISESKMYVTTGFTMAEVSSKEQPIEELYTRSRLIVKDFHGMLKEHWKEFGISTAARPTYRMDKSYAHVKASFDRVKELISRAGI